MTHGAKKYGMVQNESFRTIHYCLAPFGTIRQCLVPFKVQHRTVPVLFGNARHCSVPFGTLQDWSVLLGNILHHLVMFGFVRCCLVKPPFGTVQHCLVPFRNIQHINSSENGSSIFLTWFLKHTCCACDFSQLWHHLVTFSTIRSIW